MLKKGSGEAKAMWLFIKSCEVTVGYCDALWRHQDLEAEIEGHVTFQQDLLDTMMHCRSS